MTGATSLVNLLRRAAARIPPGNSEERNAVHACANALEDAAAGQPAKLELLVSMQADGDKTFWTGLRAVSERTSSYGIGMNQGEQAGP